MGDVDVVMSVCLVVNKVLVVLVVLVLLDEDAVAIVDSINSDVVSNCISTTGSVTKERLVVSSNSVVTIEST